jgi:hypothetical protein
MPVTSSWIKFVRVIPRWSLAEVLLNQAPVAGSFEFDLPGMQ